MNSELTFRLATSNDLSTIVSMLADDSIGATREKWEAQILDSYVHAFERIAADPNQELTVVEMRGEIVATFQLTFIQYLTHQGGLRAQIEAVRTHKDHRGKGIGKKVFEYVIMRARQHGCNMAQLTSDKNRADAIRFYQSMGFVATHEGMKLKLIL
jgi:GNAT superfamily N-acetyltransferase